MVAVMMFILEEMNRKLFHDTMILMNNWRKRYYEEEGFYKF